MVTTVLRRCVNDQEPPDLGIKSGKQFVSEGIQELILLLLIRKQFFILQFEKFERDLLMEYRRMMVMISKGQYNTDYVFKLKQPIMAIKYANTLIMMMGVYWAIMLLMRGFTLSMTLYHWANSLQLE